MGTITTGVGLFSGLDYASLVDQLIAIEAAPRDQLLVRMSNLDAQRTALMDISARVSALLAQANTLSNTSLFNGTTATSSNPSVLSVSAGAGVMPGAYTFVVRALATSHQLVSRGFTSPSAAVGTGTFTLESAAARVNGETTLEELNGYIGVQRGSFEVVDGEGDRATISINAAQTVADVLDAVNSADIGVHAELGGEGIVLRDTTGGGQGVRVREVGSGHTAADLGFATGNTYSADGELQGRDLVRLAGTTPLSALNDGLGLRRAIAGTDFVIQSSAAEVEARVKLSEIISDTTRLERLNHAGGVDLGVIRITTRDGVSTEVDLTEAQTVGDVKQIIEETVADVSVVLASGRLLVSDGTEGEATDFSIQDSEGHAARDLGILDSTEGDSIDGNQILFVDTLADVVAAVNYAEGNQYDASGDPVIEASIAADGKRLVITDHGGGSGLVFSVPESSNSQALADLGFLPDTYGATASGGRIIGGIDTVLLKTLNGGQGFAGGTIGITANGGSAQVDLADAETLRDVIERINVVAEDSGLGIEAGYDGTGTRLQIVNLADDTGEITITDVEGEFAASVGIAASGTRIASENLQRRYVSETTQLDDLNLGAGVMLGKFRITDSSGMIGVVDLAAEGAETVQDVIAAINDLDGVEVEARINDTGDGLLLVDQAGGAGTLKVEEDGGTTARDLNILGESGAENQIDGSYEYKIDLAEAGTLTGLVGQINTTTLAAAHVINDGSGTAPYRLSITSRATGLAGELIVDAGDTALDFTTLTRAQDACVSMGSVEDGGLLITSSSNTLSDIVDGLSLTLMGADDEPITVTVDRDVAAMTTLLQGLVDSYNSLMDRIDAVSSYNADTERKGILFADSALRTIENRLFRAFSGTVPGVTGRFTRLSQLGVSFGSGGKLTFDEEKFRAAYDEDPAAVSHFFTAAEVGLGQQLKEQLEAMTDSGGLIDRRDDALEDQRELLSERVESLNAMLELKRERLLRQFQAMESALAELQSQQSALTSLSSLLSSNSVLG